MILPHTPLYFYTVMTNYLFAVTVIIYYVTRSQALPHSAEVDVFRTSNCIRYFMQEDVFRVIPGVFGITLANEEIFEVGIFTVLER